MIVKENGIDYKIAFTNRAAVAFEKSITKIREELKDTSLTAREYWQMIVQFGIDCKALDVDIEDAGEMRPAVIELLAEKIPEAYREATSITLE